MDTYEHPIHEIAYTHSSIDKGCCKSVLENAQLIVLDFLPQKCFVLHTTLTLLHILFGHVPAVHIYILFTPLNY